MPHPNDSAEYSLLAIEGMIQELRTHRALNRLTPDRKAGLFAKIGQHLDAASKVLDVHPNHKDVMAAGASVPPAPLAKAAG